MNSLEGLFRITDFFTLYHTIVESKRIVYVIIDKIR